MKEAIIMILQICFVFVIGEKKLNYTNEYI